MREDEDLSYIEAEEVTEKNFGKMLLLAGIVWLIDRFESAVEKAVILLKKKYFSK